MVTPDCTSRLAPSKNISATGRAVGFYGLIDPQATSVARLCSVAGRAALTIVIQRLAEAVSPQFARGRDVNLPCGRPADVLDESARLAEREIDAGGPRAGLSKDGFERFEARQPLQIDELQLVAFQGGFEACDRLGGAAGPAREIDAEDSHLDHSART